MKPHQLVRKIFRIGFAGLIGGLITTSIGHILLIPEFGRKVIALSYDVPYAARPFVPVDDAAIIYIDDISHDELKQDKNKPWDRELHARLLRRLKADGAKAVVFDVVFSDPGPSPEKDQALADAIKDFGNVILGADYVNSTYGVRAKSRQVVPPYERLIAEADRVNIGLVELEPGNDLIVRKHFHGDKDGLANSMSWAVAEMMHAPVTRSGKPSEAFQERWVNYYGPPAHIPNVSYYQALVTKTASANSTGVPPGFFRNKVVFIGSRMITVFAGDRKDAYPHPFPEFRSVEKFFPGVEIHATQYLNLLRGEWLSRLPRSQEELLVLLLGLAFGVGLVQARPFVSALIALVGAIAITVTAYFLVIQAHLWFAWFIVVGFQIPAALLWAILVQSVNLYVDKRLMQQTLSMYVSPKRVNQISRNQEMMKPGAEKQELSILFSDIANFTSMSEGMDSDELARVMNNYFEKAVGNCIHSADGTVVKFIGDAIFAIWNAPERQHGHQEMACQGALLLSKEVSAFTSAKPGLDVRTRIGLHSGVANVGNFGSSTRMDYTALGENINLASRMEGLNKYMGTDVLITGDVYRAVSDKFTTRFCGNFKLKGFERAVEVYELIADKAQAEETRPWREAYAAALKLYLKQDFGGAETAWHKVIEMRGGKDGPSKFMLKHLAEMRAQPLDPEWNGEVELKEK